MMYFGTDGIRGIANKELTTSLAYKCGFALTRIKKNPKILIASDTRKSKELICFSFLSGFLSGGGDVIDIGVAPTSVVSYLLTYLKCDFGVVISASHNPKEYNGIKIFNSAGEKIDDKTECLIEEQIINPKINENEKIGSYVKNTNLINKYINYIIENINIRLNGIKVVIDLSNGASYKVAPKIFKELGANVVAINDNKTSEINENCGSQFLDGLKKNVLIEKADIGIAFDGDADRIICVDHTGSVVDGDILIYILALSFKKRNLLKNNVVVGTTQTNLKIENKLKQKGINFLRSDVGDKYVIEKMKEFGSSLGGEQSGHIILKDILPTGDGILAGLKIMEIMKMENKTLRELSSISLMPQIATNIMVKDKVRIKNSEELSELIKKIEEDFDGRVIVRASGTENKIRILVEGKSKTKLKQITEKLVSLINKLNVWFIRIFLFDC